MRAKSQKMDPLQSAYSNSFHLLLLPFLHWFFDRCYTHQTEVLWTTKRLKFEDCLFTKSVSLAVWTEHYMILEDCLSSPWKYSCPIAFNWIWDVHTFKLTSNLHCTHNGLNLSRKTLLFDTHYTYITTMIMRLVHLIITRTVFAKLLTTTLFTLTPFRSQAMAEPTMVTPKTKFTKQINRNNIFALNLFHFQ